MIIHSSKYFGMVSWKCHPVLPYYLSVFIKDDWQVWIYIRDWIVTLRQCIWSSVFVVYISSDKYPSNYYNWSNWRHVITDLIHILDLGLNTHILPNPSVCLRFRMLMVMWTYVQKEIRFHIQQATYVLCNLIWNEIKSRPTTQKANDAPLFI